MESGKAPEAVFSVLRHRRPVERHTGAARWYFRFRRGSPWEKTGANVIVPAGGAEVPPAPAVTGAGRHDVSQIRRLPDSFVIDRPDISGRPRNLRLGVFRGTFT
ncbi:MAG: transposase [Treponematales bacterium]